jgi:hypothetical protein
MAQLLKQKITRKELDEGIIPQNYVLAEAYYSSENARTKSGIIYGVDVDKVFQDADKTTVDSHAADMAEVALRVYKLPERLYFNPDDVDKSMPWEVECIELCESDIIFTNIIDSLNAVTLECEGKNYKLIPYQDVYCAKREIWVDKWSIPQKKKTVVVMVNGYVLFLPKTKSSLSALDVTSQDKIDKTVGIVAYTGTPNKRYVNPEYSDFKDLQEGDEILFDKKYAFTYLERVKYASQFDDTQLYGVVQRRKINAVVNR